MPTQAEKDRRIQALELAVEMGKPGEPAYDNANAELLQIKGQSLKSTVGSALRKLKAAPAEEPVADPMAAFDVPPPESNPFFAMPPMKPPPEALPPVPMAAALREDSPVAAPPEAGAPAGPPALGEALRLTPQAAPEAPELDYTQNDVGTLGAFGSDRLRNIGKDLRAGVAGRKGVSPVSQGLGVMRLLENIKNRKEIDRRAGLTLSQRQEEDRTKGIRHNEDLEIRRDEGRLNRDATKTNQQIAREHDEEMKARSVRETINNSIQTLRNVALSGPASHGLISGPTEQAYQELATTKGWKAIAAQSAAKTFAPEWQARLNSTKDAVATLVREISGRASSDNERADLRMVVAALPNQPPNVQLQNVIRLGRRMSFAVENLPEKDRAEAKRRFEEVLSEVEQSFNVNATFDKKASSGEPEKKSKFGSKIVEGLLGGVARPARRFRRLTGPKAGSTYTVSDDDGAEGYNNDLSTALYGVSTKDLEEVK